jgi:HSP20 family protein
MNKLDLYRTKRDMDFFNDPFNGFLRDFFDVLPERTRNISGITMDLSETEQNVIATIEAPGINPKDIDISLLDGILTIKGEKNVECNKTKYISERYSGSFSRQVLIPCDVKSDEIKASFKDGIITITMPKLEEKIKEGVKIKLE